MENSGGGDTRFDAKRWKREFENSVRNASVIAGGTPFVATEETGDCIDVVRAPRGLNLPQILSSVSHPTVMVRVPAPGDDRNHSEG
ncbi:hypothetical protein A4G99_03580 [Haladaptatus sp. R4]|nr:hypothetical protein A4G99_03580 [Haladaptatus sp. R4]